MSDFYSEHCISNSKMLCIGTISNREAMQADSDIVEGIGLYLFVADSTDPKMPIEILARVASEEAAARLSMFVHMEHLVAA